MDGISHGTMLVLPPELLGSVDRYIHMSRHRSVTVDVSMPYDKRAKTTHRFTIADTRGQLNVTIPIAHPQAHHGTKISDILLSDHSPWWLTAMTALESAYGRTPYFEFYADDLLPMFDAGRVGTPLVDLCRDLEALMCRLIGLSAPRYGSAELQDDAVDMRRGIRVVDDFRPYYQVRADKLGFLPHMSVADLLFNLGPESLLYLEGEL